MKKILIVLVAMFTLASCNKEDGINLPIGEFDGEYQRVSYAIVQSPGVSVIFTPPKDEIVTISIHYNEFTWIDSSSNPFKLEGTLRGKRLVVSEEVVGSLSIDNKGQLIVTSPERDKRITFKQLR